MSNSVKPKIFDLSQRRPKVLLVGNGLIYGSSVSWDKFIKRTARSGVDFSHYEMLKKDGSHSEFLVPNTVLTLATSVIENDSERRKKYANVLSENSYPQNDNLKRLLALPWDAVLTTNYSYEIEHAQKPNFHKLSDGQKGNYSFYCSNKSDGKYLIHTFNRVTPNSSDVWHIHGEARRTSSIILSHDEYIRLASKIIEHNNRRGNDYQNYYNRLKFSSWIDYFINGDVTIIGFSMDFSEIDLWWLLGRRLREKAGHGVMRFYEPRKCGDKMLEAKHYALLDSGVDSVETCGIEINDSSQYEEFYEKAINDIVSSKTIK